MCVYGVCVCVVCLRGKVCMCDEGEDGRESRHRHTETQAHTDTHRHTHRHTDTQTRRHTDTHLETERAAVDEVTVEKIRVGLARLAVKLENVDKIIVLRERMEGGKKEREEKGRPP